MRVFANKERTVIDYRGAGTSMYDAPAPTDAAVMLEFDEASNRRAVALLTSSDDLSEFRIDDELGLVHDDKPVKINDEHPATRKARDTQAVFDRLFRETGPIDASDVRLVLQQLAMRAGVTVPRANDVTETTPE